MNDHQKNLALKIMQCRQIKDARSDESHPCHQVVNCQTGTFQSPEPWNGNINAPILFLSSNPGYDPQEDTVTLNENFTLEKAWDNERALEHFENRLSKNIKTNNGEGYPRFWSFIKNYASEIMEDQPIAGHDYWSSEIVHCKSTTEAKGGIHSATKRCAELYVDNLLTSSCAKLIVLIGAKVRNYFSQKHSFPLAFGTIIVYTLNNREFMLVSIPHPNRRGKGKKDLISILGDEKLAQIRSYYRLNCIPIS